MLSCDNINSFRECAAECWPQLENLEYKIHYSISEDPVTKYGVETDLDFRDMIFDQIGTIYLEETNQAENKDQALTNISFTVDDIRSIYGKAQHHKNAESAKKLAEVEVVEETQHDDNVEVEEELQILVTNIDDAFINNNGTIEPISNQDNDRASIEVTKDMNVTLVESGTISTDDDGHNASDHELFVSKKQMILELIKDNDDNDKDEKDPFSNQNMLIHKRKEERQITDHGNDENKFESNHLMISRLKNNDEDVSGFDAIKTETETEQTAQPIPIHNEEDPLSIHTLLIRKTEDKHDVEMDSKQFESSSMMISTVNDEKDSQHILPLQEDKTITEQKHVQIIHTSIKDEDLSDIHLVICNKNENVEDEQKEDDFEDSNLVCNLVIAHRHLQKDDDEKDLFGAENIKMTRERELYDELYDDGDAEFASERYRLQQPMEQELKAAEDKYKMRMLAIRIDNTQQQTTTHHLSSPSPRGASATPSVFSVTELKASYQRINDKLTNAQLKIDELNIVCNERKRDSKYTKDMVQNTKDKLLDKDDEVNHDLQTLLKSYNTLSAENVHLHSENQALYVINQLKAVYRIDRMDIDRMSGLSFGLRQMKQDFENKIEMVERKRVPPHEVVSDEDNAYKKVEEYRTKAAETTLKGVSYIDKKIEELEMDENYTYCAYSHFDDTAKQDVLLKPYDPGGNSKHVMNVITFVWVCIIVILIINLSIQYEAIIGAGYVNTIFYLLYSHQYLAHGNFWHFPVLPFIRISYRIDLDVDLTKNHLVSVDVYNNDSIIGFESYSNYDRYLQELQYQQSEYILSDIEQTMEKVNHGHIEFVIKPLFTDP